MVDDRFFVPLLATGVVSFLVSFVLIGGDLMNIPLQWTWAQTWRRLVAAGIALALTGVAAVVLNAMFP